MGNSLKSLKEQPHSTLYEPLLSVSEGENLRVFSFAELKKATKNFRQSRVVDGNDYSYRTFYKGYIDEATFAPFRTKTGTAVSVLDCDGSYPLSNQEISKERMQSLGRISHPNVVKLLGYSWEDDKRQFLVFEYFHKGSLDRHIYGKEEEALTWETRVKIAVGAAQALAFIHIIKNRPLYRELRMDIIMLDEQYNAKLFYIEPTKEYYENECRIRGAVEYEPPEYLQQYYWDAKCDVFTFGVILLDLLTGSKETLLNERTKGLRNGTSVLTDDHNIGEIIDPRLGNGYPVNAATQMGTLITRCTKWDKHQRPLMQEVVDTLHYIAEIKNGRETTNQS